MVDAQNKIVSIAAFRAAKPAPKPTATAGRTTGTLSPRGIEHRERMLRYLRMEALQRKEDIGEVQGRLLL